MSRPLPRREAVGGAVCTVVGEHMVNPPVSELPFERFGFFVTRVGVRARRPPNRGRCKSSFTKDMNVYKVCAGCPYWGIDLERAYRVGKAMITTQIP
jgi:hypothetical protein